MSKCKDEWRESSTSTTEPSASESFRSYTPRVPFWQPSRRGVAAPKTDVCPSKGSSAPIPFLALGLAAQHTEMYCCGALCSFLTHPAASVIFALENWQLHELVHLSSQKLLRPFLQKPPGVFFR